MKKKVSWLLICILVLTIVGSGILLATELDDEYIHRKARMAPSGSEDKELLTTHNDYIGVQLDDETGKFNEGTYPDGVRLLYSYPSSPWSSWTMVHVDGVDYCNSAGVEELPITTDFEVIAHTGDSSFIYGGWTTPEDIKVMQTLMPVYLVYPEDTMGTVFIKYDVTNTSESTCHDVSILLQMDTQINTNDAAELATSRGYSGVSEAYYIDDEEGMPPFWLAYEDPAGPTGPEDQLIAMGILSGWDAVTPDEFQIGQWGTLYSTEWDITPTGSDYSDSAVRLYWHLDSLCPGESRTVSTYYGLGKEYRMGSIGLTIEPVDVIDCEFTPNPFNILMVFSNATGMPITDAVATITLPEGYLLATGDVNVDLGDLSSGATVTTDWNVVITPDAPLSDTIWFDVTSPDLEFPSQAYYVMSLPDVGSAPSAEIVEPLHGTVTSCADQILTVDLEIENGLVEESLQFMFNGELIGLDDPRLTWDGDLVVFTPDELFNSGDIVEYALVAAVDGMGCELVEAVAATFVVDTEAPYAFDEFPENDAVLGYTDLEEITIHLVEDLREIDETTVELIVNEVNYSFDHPAIYYDDEVLHFNFETAGIVPEDGDSFCITLNPVADLEPNYCDANVMPEPYSWCFRINIIDLALPDTIAEVGDTLEIFIDIEDITNIGIVDFDILIDYFPSIIDIIDVEAYGVTESWGEGIVWSTDDGDLSISGVGDSLNGGGELLKITFVVDIDVAGSYTPLRFVNATFNEGSLTSAPIDGFVVIDWTDYEFLQELKAMTKDGNVQRYIAFGTSERGTEGYDPGLDIGVLPFIPGEIFAYFSVVDDEFPYITQLKRNIQYYAGHPITWHGHIEYASLADTVVLSWDPDIFPAGLFTMRYTTSEGEFVINMRSDDSMYFTEILDFTITYDQPVIGRNTFSVCRGWNLVSLPFLPSGDMEVSDIFPNAITSAYTYDPVSRAYVEFEYPEAGVGFWIFMPESEEIDIAGSRIDVVETMLYRGWNLLGVPYLDGSELGIISNPDGIVLESNIYWFDACGAASYQSPDGEFYSGLGYFVPATANGTITLGEGLAKSVDDGFDASYKIDFNTMDGNVLTIGFDDYANADIDNYDVLLPPASPSNLINAGFKKDGFVLSTDVRSTLHNGSTEDFELLYSGRLSWNQAELNEKLDFSMEASGRIIDMKEVSSAEVNGLAKITVSKALPAVFEILGAAPNPANPAITVTYTLPSDNEVVFEVYNITGKKVYSNDLGTVSAGTSSITWSGSDNNFSSGIYFYRINAGNQSKSGRFMFVR